VITEGQSFAFEIEYLAKLELKIRKKSDLYIGLLRRCYKINNKYFFFSFSCMYTPINNALYIFKFHVCVTAFSTLLPGYSKAISWVLDIFKDSRKFYEPWTVSWAQYSFMGSFAESWTMYSFMGS